MAQSLKKEIEYQGNPVTLSFCYRKADEDLIVCIHGLGCTKDSFQGIWGVERLKKFSILALDLPGFGESEPIKDHSVTLDAHAEVCKLLIETLDYSRIHILGHSMSAAVGELLAERLGERLISYVNVEGVLIPEQITKRHRKLFSTPYEDFLKVLSAHIERFAKSDDPSSQLWAAWMRLADPRTFYKTARSLVELLDSGSILEKFKLLQTKKAYIYGTKFIRDNVLEVIQGIEQIPISDAGHFVMIDRPEEFYRTISKWVGSSFK